MDKEGGSKIQEEENSAAIPPAAGSFVNSVFRNKTQALTNNYGSTTQNNISFIFNETGPKVMTKDDGPCEDFEELLFPYVDPQPSYDLAMEKARKLEPGTRVGLLKRLRDTCARKPCCILLADAGMGKSCVMGAFAIEHCSALKKDRAQTVDVMNVAAIHFFRYVDDTQCKLETCVVSLIKQLCESVPVLRKYVPLKAEFQQIMSGASSARNKARFLLSELIIKPCRKLEKPPAKSVMIIDALDECEDSDAMTAAIQDLWAKSDDDVASDQAPSWLVLLASTRRDNLTITRLKSFDFITIEQDRDDNLVDIRIFIDRRLKQWKVEHARGVTEVIIEKCKGVFLWLEYQEKELRKCAEEGSLTASSVEDFPEGLEKIYVDYFGRIKEEFEKLHETCNLPSDDYRLDDLYRTAIAIALLAPREALPEVWWRICLGFGEASLENNRLYARVKTAFSKLLIFDEGSRTIRAPHKSMIDFIKFSRDDSGDKDPSVLELQVELSPRDHETIGKAFHAVFAGLQRSFTFEAYDQKTKFALSHVVYHLGKAPHLDACVSCYLDLPMLMRICDAARIDGKVERVIEEAEEYYLADASARVKYCVQLLRLSSRSLAIDVRMLPGQILGRLGCPPYDDDQTHFANQAERWFQDNKNGGGPPVARPIHNWLSGLDFAGGSLEQTYYFDGPVKSVVIGRNDEVCVACGNSVRIFVRKAGRKEERVLSGHTNAVTSVAISNDSKWVVTGSWDRTARLWNLESGREERVFSGHSRRVTSVAISEDSNWIVTGSRDYTARLWSAKSGMEVRLFSGHSNRVNCVAISNDLKWVVTGSKDNTARLWSLQSGMTVRVFSEHSEKVTSVAISKDSKWVVTGAFDRTARLWSLEVGVEERLFPSKLWSSHSGEIEREFRGHSRDVTSVMISEDTKWIVTASGDRTARLWNLESGKEERVFRGHSDVVTSIATSSDSQWAVTGSDDCTARLWNLHSGKAEGEIGGHLNEVTSVAIADDSNRIVTGSLDGTARLWNLRSGKEERVLIGHSDVVTSVAISNDLKWIVTGSYDETARLWDLQSGKEGRVFRGHSREIASVAISRCSKWIVTGSYDKTVQLWNLESGDEERVFKGHSDVVTTVAISIDSKWIVTSSLDGTARLWNLENGNAERVFRRNSSKVTSVAISNDSKWILTSSDDKTARLWDLESGKESRVFSGHLTKVTSVAISKDTKWIVTFGAHFNPVIHDVVTGKVGSLLKYFQSLPRSFYPGDRYRFMGKMDQSVGFVLDAQANLGLIGGIGDLIFTASTVHRAPVCWTLDS